MIRRSGVAALAAIGAVIWGAPVNAEDWPQWMGPTRDNVWTETGVLGEFPAAGPTIKWRTPIGGGYSGPAVADGRVFVGDYQLQRGEPVSDPGSRPKLEGQERLVCLDAATGNELWVHSKDQPYEISYPSGPRCTATVDGDRVYFLGAEGKLTCLKVENGDEIWALDLKAEYEAPTPVWGFCGHPLVDGDRLYVMAGGAGSAAVCLDKHTGRELWKALTGSDAGYCPPSLIEHNGRRQLIIWHPQAINSLDPETGKVSWSVALEPAYGMSITPPVHSGDYLFAGGIDDVGVMLKLQTRAKAPQELWRSSNDRGLGPVHSPPMIVGDVLFGVDREGELRSIDLKTGERRWETYEATTGDRRAGSSTAFLIRNGERWWIFNERGDLIIGRLTPEGYQEFSRAHIIEPNQTAFGRDVVWSAPAFANRCAFVRNNSEIVCVDLAAAP